MAHADSWHFRDRSVCALSALLRLDGPDGGGQSSTICCEVDYARGGGSSGALVRDESDGVSVRRGLVGRFCCRGPSLDSATTKPAAHEAKS